MDQKNLLEFPCLFSIKVMGINNPEFLPQIVNIISNNCVNFNSTKDIIIKHSKNHKYISITANIMATSQEHLNKIYLILNKNELVQMTL